MESKIIEKTLSPYKKKHRYPYPFCDRMVDARNFIAISVCESQNVKAEFWPVAIPNYKQVKH